jgi:hypothetical protein
MLLLLQVVPNAPSQNCNCTQLAALWFKACFTRYPPAWLEAAGTVRTMQTVMHYPPTTPQAEPNISLDCAVICTATYQAVKTGQGCFADQLFISFGNNELVRVCMSEPVLNCYNQV